MPADPLLKSTLEQGGTPVNLVDETGEVVGVAMSKEEYLRYLYATVKVPISQEEIERRFASKSGRSLEEIWKRLGVK
jgi:hypothetical protein